MFCKWAETGLFHVPAIDRALSGRRLSTDGWRPFVSSTSHAPSRYRRTWCLDAYYYCAASRRVFREPSILSVTSVFVARCLMSPPTKRKHRRQLNSYCDGHVNFVTYNPASSIFSRRSSPCRHLFALTICFFRCHKFIEVRTIFTILVWNCYWCGHFLHSCCCSCCCFYCCVWSAQGDAGQRRISVATLTRTTGRGRTSGKGQQRPFVFILG